MFIFGVEVLRYSLTGHMTKMDDQEDCHLWEKFCPESHWHWVWVFSFRKWTHFIVHRYNLFFPLLNTSDRALGGAFGSSQSVVYFTLSDSSYFSEALIQTLQSTLVWQDAAASRLWSETRIASPEAFCVPQHVVCVCSVPSFKAGLCPGGVLVCQLLYPEISSMFSYQTLALMYCFNKERYYHFWSATEPDGKFFQHHKSHFVQSPLLFGFLYCEYWSFLHHLVILAASPNSRFQNITRVLQLTTLRNIHQDSGVYMYLRSQAYTLFPWDSALNKRVTCKQTCIPCLLTWSSCWCVWLCHSNCPHHSS